MAKGFLRVETYQLDSLVPFQGAKVTITPISPEGKPMHKIELKTNEIGRTDEIELAAPPKEESLHPGSKMPYSIANITVSAPGYKTVVIKGTQILPDQLSIQPVNMFPIDNTQKDEKITIEIPKFILDGNYPRYRRKLNILKNDSLNHDIFKEKKFIPPSVSAFRNPIPTVNYYDED